MKSLNQNQLLTKTEKEEAQKYNNELFRLTGIKYRIRTIRDYYLVKILYLSLQIYSSDEVMDYYDNLLHDYYLLTKIDNDKFEIDVRQRTLEDYFFNEGYTEALYKHWQKYYYPTCMNFVSFLAIYSGDMLPFITFENTMNTALNKTVKFIEEESVQMIRDEMSYISEMMQDSIYEFDYYYTFTWYTRHDERVCKICRELDGKEFYYEEVKAHPNCRCYLLMKSHGKTTEHKLESEVDLIDE